MTKAPSLPDERQPSQNLGFLVGKDKYEGLLPKPDIDDLEAMLVADPDDIETIMTGAILAIDRLKQLEQQSAANVRGAEEAVERSRGIMAPLVGKKAIESKQADTTPVSQRRIGTRSRGSKPKRSKTQKLLGTGIRRSMERRPVVDAESPWPVFHAAGRELIPQEEVQDDGMINLRLRAPRSRHETSDIKDDLRLSYRIWPSKDESDIKRAQLMGLKIPAELRGHRLSKRLLTYFLEGLEKQGIDFMGTGLVHKPIMALVFSEMGLVPENHDFVAAILPRQAGDNPHIPRIAFVKEGRDKSRVVTHSRGGGHKFYTRNPLPEDIDPKRVVALHTRYRLPKDPIEWFGQPRA